MDIYEINGHRVMELPASGSPLGSESDAVEILGEAFGVDAMVVVIPVERLDPDFLDLSSRLAGLFYQKLQNYGRRLVVLGDISGPLAASKSLRDFVYETNSIGNHLFAPDRNVLSTSLS